MDEKRISEMGPQRLQELASSLPGPDQSCEGFTGPLYDQIDRRAEELGITVDYNSAPPAQRIA